MDTKIYMDQAWQAIKELAEQKKDTDRQLRELKNSIKETGQQLKKTDLQLKETSEVVKEISKKAENYFGKVREIDRNWGKLEALVAPSVAKQFRVFEIEGTARRVEKQKNGKTIEIDILLTNSTIIIPVEVKTTLDVNAVNQHIEKHLIPFKKFFKEYGDKTIYGAVAYINVEEDADRYAYKKGLYVLTFGDNDMVVIKNDDKFKPVSW